MRHDREQAVAEGQQLTAAERSRGVEGGAVESRVRRCGLGNDPGGTHQQPQVLRRHLAIGQDNRRCRVAAHEDFAERQEQQPAGVGAAHHVQLDAAARGRRHRGRLSGTAQDQGAPGLHPCLKQRRALVQWSTGQPQAWAGVREQSTQRDVQAGHHVVGRQLEQDVDAAARAGVGRRQRGAHRASCCLIRRGHGRRRGWAGEESGEPRPCSACPPPGSLAPQIDQPPVLCWRPDG